jgi:hypothetical protein
MHSLGNIILCVYVCMVSEPSIRFGKSQQAFVEGTLTQGAAVRNCGTGVDMKQSMHEAHRQHSHLTAHMAEIIETAAGRDR